LYVIKSIISYRVWKAVIFSYTTAICGDILRPTFSKTKA
jgi:hypothetical protein